MPYQSLEALPEGAVGDNGRPTLMLSPMETSDHALMPLTGNGVKGLRIFKTAKGLKDSKGRAKDWSREDLEQMVANFHLLREKNILPNVPVRENHSRDVKQIGGYFSNISVSTTPDLTGNFFLEADLDFTEPDMQAKYERGTYRNRSIEIGAYETNEGEIYFPVVLGLAFCDIPAVEGLYEAALSSYSADNKPEIMVYAPDNGADASGNTATSAPKTAATFDRVITELNSVLTGLGENPDAQNAVQKVIQAVEALKGATAQTATPAPTNASGDEMPETFKFTLDGSDIEIAGDDQTRRVIETLYSKTTEQATQIAEFIENQRQAAEKARVAAVDSWLHDKKITPAEVDAQKAYVKTLTDEQFTAHAALTTGRPDLAFTVANPASGDGTPDESREAQIREHTQTLEMLKHAGMSPEKLAVSKPAKALAALNVPVEV
jgi:hypothetical protein